ncbi:hypothetical protein SDC9_157425 [bioreactor metagenome]|uniref:Uncharacterized protein n=1 Tax=bioreactor metagenome TaxID=1076179 RepID=A0A645F8A0_9ZZZZ
MCKQDAAQHHFFAYFLRAGFHHHHGVLGAGHHQVQQALFTLLAVRVQDIFAVHIPYHDRPGRPRKGDARNTQRNGGTDHPVYIRRDIVVHRKHGRDHLHVVEIALWKQRTNGPVDQTRRQDRLFGRPSFPL